MWTAGRGSLAPAPHPLLGGTAAPLPRVQAGMAGLGSAQLASLPRHTVARAAAAIVAAGERGSVRAPGRQLAPPLLLSLLPPADGRRDSLSRRFSRIRAKMDTIMSFSRIFSFIFAHPRENKRKSSRKKVAVHTLTRGHGPPLLVPKSIWQLEACFPNEQLNMSRTR